ncbi:hypothetical protein H6G89_26570 [Oscillatoria sp. FACHB-1407]|uniref:hypothetical protein n=1 Tax=Oscillatoria sp. FACHB-1407 TaxID=2692847 RepID=UPI00168694B8|nr:hypothetical protein [Oscillatoria sp. FACHB-1407]MBD2464576.1 hypothetical protein [Oscillatoria sp. FACHB-1407]
MHPIDVLPNAMMQQGLVSEQFLKQGITTFQAACHWTKALPYGSNSNSEDSLILFEEGHGTCTTKHGAIARLAQELNLPVYKNLGFYRLNDEVVTGVNALLQPYGLNFIPQIHCFLEYEHYRVDLTEGNCNGKNKTIEDYDFVVRVTPDITHDEERRYYLDYLQRYDAIAPELLEISETTLLEILDACNRQVKYQCSLMASQLVTLS